MKKLDLENAFAQKLPYPCSRCYACNTIHSTLYLAIAYDDE